MSGGDVGDGVEVLAWVLAGAEVLVAVGSVAMPPAADVSAIVVAACLVA